MHRDCIRRPLSERECTELAQKDAARLKERTNKAYAVQDRFVEARASTLMMRSFICSANGLFRRDDGLQRILQRMAELGTYVPGTDVMDATTATRIMTYLVSVVLSRPADA